MMRARSRCWELTAATCGNKITPRFIQHLQRQRLWIISDYSDYSTAFFLPNIRHGGYTHSSNWNGSEPVACPKGQAASDVWVHRPKVSFLPCPGEWARLPGCWELAPVGVTCKPCTGNHQWSTGQRGVRLSWGTSWAGPWGVVLGPRLDLCLACFYWALPMLVLCTKWWFRWTSLPPCLWWLCTFRKIVQKPLYHPAWRGDIQLLVGRWHKNKKGKGLLCFSSLYSSYNGTKKTLE